jgi:hypothetical protein
MSSTPGLHATLISSNVGVQCAPIRRCIRYVHSVFAIRYELSFTCVYSPLVPNPSLLPIPFCTCIIDGIILRPCPFFIQIDIGPSTPISSNTHISIKRMNPRFPESQPKPIIGGRLTKIAESSSSDPLSAVYQSLSKTCNSCSVSNVVQCMEERCPTE